MYTYLGKPINKKLITHKLKQKIQINKDCDKARKKKTKTKTGNKHKTKQIKKNHKN